MQKLLIATAVLSLFACKPKAPEATAPPPQPAQPASQPASRPSTSRADAATSRLEDSPAGTLVLRAINRAGGLAAWYAGGALEFDYAYRPVGEGPVRRSTQVVEIETARAYHALDEPMKGTFAWDGQKAWMKLPGEEKFGARFWALTPYYFVAMPFVLGDPGVRLEKLADDPKAASIDEAADVVKVTFAPGTGDAPDDYYILYLAQSDGRLLALRYIVTYFGAKAGAAPKEKLLVYEDEATAGPLKLARKHTFYAFDGGKRGALMTHATVGGVVYGAKFDPSKLAMPEGAVIDSSKGSN